MKKLWNDYCLLCLIYLPFLMRMQNFLQSTLKRLNINAVSGMEEVRIEFEDGTQFVFKTPKVSCNAQANAFILQGEHEVIKSAQSAQQQPEVPVSTENAQK